MNKQTLKNKICKSEYRLKNSIYDEFIENWAEFVLEVLEMNYLSDIGFWTGCIDGDRLRRKVKNSINLHKLKKILPEYVKEYKKGQYNFKENTLDLVPLTNKVQKQIWERIKHEQK